MSNSPADEMFAKPLLEDFPVLDENLAINQTARLWQDYSEKITALGAASINPNSHEFFVSMKISAN